MKRKIFSFSLVFLLVFVFGSLFVPNITLADNNTSATISPTLSFIGQSLTYTYTITNDGSSTANIGSAEIQLPVGFGTPSISILSASSSRTWVLGSSGGYVNGFNLITGKIGIQADGSSSKLDFNEFVTIQITTTASATPNSYEWIASVWANLGFTGTSFPLSSQPTVNVIIPTLSSIAITTPATKLEYTVGDTLDITGLAVTGTMSDSSTETETITASNITGFDSSVPVTGQVLTITDGAQTVTYTVNINASSGGNVATHLNLTINVDVPSSCDATDTDGVKHNYPQGNSYLAICALEAAISNGSISSAQLSNQYPSMGLFITAINNTVADPNSQYWAILQNGNLVQLGVTSLPVIAGDSIVFQLHDFSDNNLEDQVTLNIHSLISSVINSGGGSSAPSPASTFSISNAVAYLTSTQSPDGSFGGSSLNTDWAAIALAAGNAPSNIKTNIINYMAASNVVSSSLTDNERHSMALLALGQNPYSFYGTDFITPIVKAFDGAQFGDASLINDDIFALISLAKVGYTSSDPIIMKDIAFVLSKENSNGSWEGSVDLTASAIQALLPFNSVSGVSSALVKAGSFLQNAQSIDGGWGNVSSSSWAAQAMSVLGVSWTKNGKTVGDYFATQQAADGATSSSLESIENRIWKTSYAIPATLNKSWGDILQSFPKPVPTVEVKQEVLKVKNNIVKKYSKIANINTEILKTEQPIVLNNLGASAGDAISSGTSFKRIPQAIGHSVVNVLTYIGKGFYNFVSILVSPFNAIFR